jgi:hypothetical protein
MKANTTVMNVLKVKELKIILMEKYKMASLEELGLSARIQHF